jgi:hypothetical protein
VYVGSHNLSIAAWGGPAGEGNAAKGPSNVELGVVLATTCKDRAAEWRRRTPLQCEATQSYADIAEKTTLNALEKKMAEPFIRGGGYYVTFSKRPDGLAEFHESIRAQLRSHRLEDR